MINTNMLRRVENDKKQKYNRKTKFLNQSLTHFEYQFSSKKKRDFFLIKDVLNFLK